MNSSSIEYDIEKKAEKAENLGGFSGIKLLHIKNSIKDMLEVIGKNNLFDQYTKHDITHVNEMLRIAEWLIPEKTKESMTTLDNLMLVLSIYFHDLGMVVTKKEYENRMDSLFKEYKQRITNKEVDVEYAEKIASLGEDAEKFMYQEFVRSKHAERIENWINGNKDIECGEAKEVISEIDKVLCNLDSAFREDLAMICRSHHADDLDDNFNKYQTSAKYGNDKEEIVNLHYIAVILRTADLLHITKDRTPTIQYRLINPSDPISIIEWQKQMAVNSVTPKSRKNDEGRIDKSLQPDTVEIRAYFCKADQAEAFFGLTSYISYARKELERNYNMIQNSLKMEGTKEYQFPWRNIDDENIKTSGFEPKQLQFTLEQDNILQLLVGHTLYNDSTVVMREIIQNSLDAIKLQNFLDKNENKIITTGLVEVIWNSRLRELSFSDNGTGMTINEIESFLLKVGKSKYRTDEFIKKYPDFSAIGRFGIGILTCFLISDDIDIITSSEEEKDGNEISIRKVNGKYLLKKVDKSIIKDNVRKHGTIIKLHVRQAIDMTNILDNIMKWIVIPSSKVLITIDENNPVTIGYSTPKDALIDYLEKNLVSKVNVEVREESIDGVTVAYAIKYNEFLREWSFLSLENIRKENVYSIGSCVNGIRVQFSTPGYHQSSILALANIDGNSHVKTNVARSAIETNKQSNVLLKTIYTIYKNHVQSQLDELDTSGRSLAWIASESKYFFSDILPSEYNKILAQDEQLLNDVLNDVKCIILENESDARKIISPNDLSKIDEFYIVDSEMVDAAERLFREVKTDEKVCDLINTLNNDPNNKLVGMKNIICNFDNSNLLHINSLKNKEVKSIKVYKNYRRVDLKFGNKVKNWESFTLYGNNRNYSHSNIKNVYFPLESGIIEGIDNEIGVNTVTGLFLNFDHSFTNYIRDLIYKFDYKNNKDDLKLVRVLLTFIFNMRVLDIVADEDIDKNTLFDNLLERDNEFSISRDTKMGLWNKINKDELSMFLFKDKYNVYDNSKWSRGKSNSSY